MRKVFLESPVCQAALDAGDTIADFGRVFAQKFDSVTRDDIAFFKGQYELFNNRVLAMLDFIGMINEKFLFELADTMNQNPDLVIHRQISPYFNFTADLLENSCVFKRDKCRPMIVSGGVACSDHSWCIKFVDLVHVIQQVDRTGISRVVKVCINYVTDTDSDSDDTSDTEKCFGTFDIPVHQTLYSPEQIRDAKGSDMIEMLVRNRTQFNIYKTVDVPKFRHFIAESGTLRHRCVPNFNWNTVFYCGHNHPTLYHTFPRDVIIDTAECRDIRVSCRCYIGIKTADMTAEQYYKHVMERPICVSREFRHSVKTPVTADTAWPIAMRYVEKCGLVPLLDTDRRRVVETVICRKGYFHAHVTSSNVLLIRKYSSPRTYHDPNSVIFEIPVLSETGPLEVHRCKDFSVPDLPSLDDGLTHPQDITRTLYADRAVSMGIDRGTFMKNVWDAMQSRIAPRPDDNAEMRLVHECAAACARAPSRRASF